MGSELWLYRHPRSDPDWWATSLFRMACEASGHPSPALAAAINRQLGASVVEPEMLDVWLAGRGSPPPDVWMAAMMVAGADLASLVESLRSVQIAGAAGKLGVDVNRRRFLGLMAGMVNVAGMRAPDPEPWERLAHALKMPKRVDTVTITELEHVTMALERLELQVSPHTLIGPVLGHLRTVTDVLNGEPPPALRQPLLSLAAETAGLAGWLVWDTTDRAPAADYFRTGLEAAREAGDSALGAYLMGSAACQPSHSEDPERRLRLLAGPSFGFHASDASPETGAWLATLEAEAHVLGSNESAVFRALDDADTAIASPRRAAIEPRPRVSFFDSARLRGERGLCLARLGRASEAQTLLAPALADLSPANLKTRPRLLTALAMAHVQREDIDEACRLGSEALSLARSQAVETNLQDVRALRWRLERWADSPAVRHFDEQLVGYA